MGLWLLPVLLLVGNMWSGARVAFHAIAILSASIFAWNADKHIVKGVECGILHADPSAMVRATNSVQRQVHHKDDILTPAVFVKGSGIIYVQT